MWFNLESQMKTSVHPQLYSTVSVLQLALWLESRSQTPINEIWSTNLLLSRFQPSVCVWLTSLLNLMTEECCPNTQNVVILSFFKLLFGFSFYFCFLFFFFSFSLSLFSFSIMNRLIMFQVKAFLSSIPNGGMSLTHTHTYCIC